jgi:hypothetical protein
MSDIAKPAAVTNLIANERAKLTATYVNGMAIAIFAVGGLAPIFSVFLSGTASATTWLVMGSSFVCSLTSVALHFVTRRFLRELAP